MPSISKLCFLLNSLIACQEYSCPSPQKFRPTKYLTPPPPLKKPQYFGNGSGLKSVNVIGKWLVNVCISVLDRPTAAVNTSNDKLRSLNLESQSLQELREYINSSFQNAESLLVKIMRISLEEPSSKVSKIISVSWPGS